MSQKPNIALESAFKDDILVGGIGSYPLPARKDLDMLLKDCTSCWSSVKQQLVALFSCEAELNAIRKGSTDIIFI